VAICNTDETGKLQRIVGIIQDITETRLAEKAVKVSQTELLEAQNHSQNRQLEV
jgi:hypothetical protein